MFSKTAGRNPRRRQRTSSDDSVKPPKAKRQRSVLRQAGDSPSAVVDLNHGRDQVDSAAPVLANDHDVAREHLGADSQLPIRSAKPSEGSKNEADGTVVLVSGLLSFVFAW